MDAAGLSDHSTPTPHQHPHSTPLRPEHAVTSGPTRLLCRLGSCEVDSCGPRPAGRADRCVRLHHLHATHIHLHIPQQHRTRDGGCGSIGTDGCSTPHRRETVRLPWHRVVLVVSGLSGRRLLPTPRAFDRQGAHLGKHSLQRCDSHLHHIREAQFEKRNFHSRETGRRPTVSAKGAEAEAWELVHELRCWGSCCSGACSPTHTGEAELGDGIQRACTAVGRGAAGLMISDSQWRARGG